MTSSVPPDFKMKTLTKTLIGATSLALISGGFVYHNIQKKENLLKLQKEKSEKCNPSDMELFRAFYSNETSVEVGTYIVPNRKEINADGKIRYTTYVLSREHFAEIIKNCSMNKK